MTKKRFAAIAALLALQACTRAPNEVSMHQTPVAIATTINDEFMFRWMRDIANHARDLTPDERVRIIVHLDNMEHRLRLQAGLPSTQIKADVKAENK